MRGPRMCIVSHDACAGLRHREVGESSGQYALFGWIAKAAKELAAVEGVCLWDADLASGHKARHPCTHALYTHASASPNTTFVAVSAHFHAFIPRYMGRPAPVNILWPVIEKTHPHVPQTVVPYNTPPLAASAYSSVAEWGGRPMLLFAGHVPKVYLSAVRAMLGRRLQPWAGHNVTLRLGAERLSPEHYWREMMQHKFCLVLRGDTPSTRKVGEAFVVAARGGCLPIFVQGVQQYAFAGGPEGASRVGWVIKNDAGFLASLSRIGRAVDAREWAMRRDRAKSIAPLSSNPPLRARSGNACSRSSQRRPPWGWHRRPLRAWRCELAHARSPKSSARTHVPWPTSLQFVGPLARRPVHALRRQTRPATAQSRASPSRCSVGRVWRGRSPAASTARPGGLAGPRGMGRLAASRDKAAPSLGGAARGAPNACAQLSARASRVLATQPLERRGVAFPSRALARPRIPRARRVLAAQPLERGGVACAGRALAHPCIPRARRVLAAQPLERGDTAFAGRLHTRPFVPWAWRGLAAQPYQHSEVGMRGRALARLCIPWARLGLGTQPFQCVQVAHFGRFVAHQFTPRARRVLGAQPCQHFDVAIPGRRRANGRIPWARRGMGAQPLDHVETTQPGPARAHPFIPRARRVLGAQPRQHGDICKLGRGFAGPLIPWARRRLGAQPNEQIKMACTGSLLAGPRISREWRRPGAHLTECVDVAGMDCFVPDTLIPRGRLGLGVQPREHMLVACLRREMPRLLIPWRGCGMRKRPLQHAQVAGRRRHGAHVGIDRTAVRQGPLQDIRVVAESRDMAQHRMPTVVGDDVLQQVPFFFLAMAAMERLVEYSLPREAAESWPVISASMSSLRSANREPRAAELTARSQGGDSPGLSRSSASQKSSASKLSSSPSVSST